VRRGLPEPPEGAVNLLRAADGDAQAWSAWRAGRNLAHLDASSFALLPTVYARLRGTGALGADDGRMAGIYRWSWVRNQVAIRAAVRAIETLGLAGIPVVALKGLPLLVLYHGDLGSRLMFDVDLLIPEERVLEAWDLLLADGWVPEVPRPTARVVPCLHAVAFTRPAGGMIDLHWKPLPFDGPPGEWDALRRRALPAEFGGRAALVPEATDLALLALLHAMRPDAHAGLRWALDLAALDRKSPLDGAALEARAAAWGFGAPVRAALERLRALLGIVPAGALAGPAPTEGAEDARMMTVLGRFGPPGRSATVLRDQHWIFRRSCAARGLPRGPVAFARYLLAYYRMQWGTRGAFDTLGLAVRRAVGGPSVTRRPRPLLARIGSAPAAPGHGGSGR
jgi:hypothetical protein